MDNAGWRARRRAAHEDAAPPATRGPDGHFPPVAQVEPIEDTLIGGWAMPTSRHPSPRPQQPYTTGEKSAQINISLPPPYLGTHLQQTGYPFASGSVSPALQGGVRPSVDGNPLSPVEPSQTPNLMKRIMQPYLEFMCGPLLRYDTVDVHAVWRGAALIVTTDAGSTYEPYPTLKYRWDPKRSTPHNRQYSVQSVDLGPHPADPMAAHIGSEAYDGHLEGPNVQEQRVLGRDIYVYSGRGGTYTFWRFLIQIPLTEYEMRIQYSINDGLELDFFIPGYHQTMRLAAYSCNGFSAGVNPEDFRGPGFQTGYDPVWVDLLAKHAQQPFHLLIGSGNQLYCDGVVREPEMQEWINQPKSEERRRYPLSDEILSAIDRFLFNHYCQTFRSGAFARANSSIPMLNMLDDRDLINGFGSYSEDWQNGPVFKAIGSRGYFFFLLFQCFINVDVDGTNDQSHVFHSLVLGNQGPFVPFPSHSFLCPFGPTSWILMLDCRAERKLGRVCSEEEYNKIFERLSTLPPRVEHLVVQLGIPIAYPRMAFLESAVSSKFNPLVTLDRSGIFDTLKGFVNRFHGDAELLGNLNDHWTSKHHKAERNQLIERFQLYALSQRIRISFLSGDVHCAAVGVFKTLKKGKRSSALPPISDHRYMLNVVSSAIVNTPPPNGVLSLVDSLSAKRHRTLHHFDTDEEMLPLFEKDTDGSKPKSQYIMGRRNWCSITPKQRSQDLLFDIRVEKEKGKGETIGYSVLAPPPRWTAKPQAVK